MLGTPKLRAIAIYPYRVYKFVFVAPAGCSLDIDTEMNSALTCCLYFSLVIFIVENVTSAELFF
jgi:hypothetical protein